MLMKESLGEGSLSISLTHLARSLQTNYLYENLFCKKGPYLLLFQGQKLKKQVGKSLNRSRNLPMEYPFHFAVLIIF